jgi:hypothetical protein
LEILVPTRGVAVLAIYHLRGQNRTSARSSDPPPAMSVTTLQYLPAGNP